MQNLNDRICFKTGFDCPELPWTVRIQFVGVCEFASLVDVPIKIFIVTLKQKILKESKCQTMCYSGSRLH